MTGVPVKVNYGGVLTEIQMVQMEADYICKTIRELPSAGKMVEWGSGGSTLKWLETLTPSQELITIEHNLNWFNRVSRAVNNEYGECPQNFTFLHAEEMYSFEHGYGHILEEHPTGTDKYLNPQVPDLNIWDAEFFFIDGIARAACLMTVLLKHTKKNPVIMIHDYVGREHWYHWAVQHCAEVKTFVDQDPNATLCQLFLNE